MSDQCVLITRKVMKFIKRLAIIVLSSPVALLLTPLLIVSGVSVFLFKLPLPKSKVDRDRENYLKKATDNLNELSEALNSLEQNNYLDTDYLMPIIRQHLMNVKLTLVILKNENGT